MKNHNHFYYPYQSSLKQRTEIYEDIYIYIYYIRIYTYIFFVQANDLTLHEYSKTACAFQIYICKQLYTSILTILNFCERVMDITQLDIPDGGTFQHMGKLIK